MTERIVITIDAAYLGCDRFTLSAESSDCDRYGCAVIERAADGTWLFSLPNLSYPLNSWRFNHASEAIRVEKRST